MISKYINAFEYLVKGYVECALWSSTDESREGGGDPLDENYGTDSIAPEAMRTMLRDCAIFWEKAEPLLQATGLGMHSAGHDLWLTRNGHGAGFWDRDLGEAGDKLTTIAKEMGQCNLYAGDDGWLYVS